jgi:hypothetical protein
MLPLSGSFDAPVLEIRSPIIPIAIYVNSTKTLSYFSAPANTVTVNKYP